MKKFIGFAGVGAGALLPLLAAAQDQTVGTVGATILGIINTVILIIMALAFLFFIVAVFRYIMAKEEKAKESARDNMIYGIIGLFVMFAVWGLVRLLANTFNLGQGLACGDFPPTCYDANSNVVPPICSPLTNTWQCPVGSE